MMKVEDCRAYIANLFSIVRELAADARGKRVADPADMDDFVRETVYVSILDLMQRDASTFDIDVEGVGMANFDPFADELHPTTNPPRKNR
jgi:hypothetical protein